METTIMRDGWDDMSAKGVVVMMVPPGNDTTSG